MAQETEALRPAQSHIMWFDPSERFRTNEFKDF